MSIGSLSIGKLHESPWYVYISSTGAGSGISTALWNEPNASNTILGSEFPYSQAALHEFVGPAWPGDISYTSEQTAIAMAQASFYKGQRIQLKMQEPGTVFRPVLGVGFTCTAPTNRTLRGGARAHLALRTPDGLFTGRMTLVQGEVSRKEGDEAYRDWVIYQILAHTTAIEALPPLVLPLEKKLPQIPENRESCLFTLNGSFEEPSIDPATSLIYPGSFNPFHAGHDLLATIAATVTGKRVVLEICGQRVGKEALGLSELSPRLVGAQGRYPVVLTKDAPLFAQKARLFPNCPFLVGGDTVRRLLSPDSYLDGRAGLQEAFSVFTQMGTSFYTFDRDGHRVEEILKDIPYAAWRDRFTILPGMLNISSTQIRGSL